MPKTHKPMSKAAAAALKAMENMVGETADLNVHIEQLREKLKPAELSRTSAPYSMPAAAPLAPPG